MATTLVSSYREVGKNEGSRDRDSTAVILKPRILYDLEQLPSKIFSEPPEKEKSLVLLMEIISISWISTMAFPKQIPRCLDHLTLTPP